MHSTYCDDYLHRWGKAPNLLNSVTYHDHRHFLPLKSVLRFFGQSRQCCPKRYFLDAKVAEESLLRDIVGADKIVKRVEERGYVNNLKPCDEEIRGQSKISSTQRKYQSCIMTFLIIFGYLRSVCTSTAPTIDLTSHIKELETRNTGTKHRYWSAG